MSQAGPSWGWQWPLVSALLYVLAFNLTFFIQELFLVLPKAFTPGLQPTLFHNNHSWTGSNPLASLFQGTGALATMLGGLACAWALERRPGRQASVSLLLFWMAFSGIFMALPQVVIGALSAQSDIGMCMAYFGLGTPAKAGLALAALAAMPLAAHWLCRRLPGPAFRTATLPALLAIPAIALFRVPREWIEVLAVPLIATIPGILLIQAFAWRAKSTTGARLAPPPSLSWPLAAVLGLLAIFQVILRPGIPF